MPRSFPEQINDWLVMTTNLQPHLSELPGFETLFDEMVSLIAEAQVLQSQREIHTAALRGTNGQRRDVEKRGEQLRLRMAARLQADFGFQNPRLREFGVQPRRERRRRSTPSTEAQAKAKAKAEAEAKAAEPPAEEQAPAPPK